MARWYLPNTVRQALEGAQVCSARTGACAAAGAADPGLFQPRLPATRTGQSGADAGMPD